MSTYLLLRDNKESGPYSVEELRSKGLKAYDLVWIEGRSAAWRYPSEVEELKSFAPIVEEQPFDRFFKKADQGSPSKIAQNNSVTAQNNSSVAVPSRPVPEKENSFSAGMNGSLISAEPSSVPGKRIIYVTLPADKGASGMRVPSFREPARVQAPIPVQEIKTHANEKEPVRTELSSLYVKAAVPAEEKFSQHADDMWRAAVELTPRQQGIGLKRILQPIIAIACVLALLAAGIFIGLSIKSDSFGFSQKADFKETPATQTPAPVQQEHVLTASAPITNTANASPVTPTPGSNSPGANNIANNTATMENAAGAPPTNPPAAVPQAAGMTSATQAPAQTQKKKTGNAKARASLTTQKISALSLPIKDSAAMGLPVVHREATHRTDDAGLDKDAAMSSISNMVSVGSGKYTVGTFGGISDLQLTVSNHSPHPLDLVVVEIQYIQANKKVFKTENLYFRGLGPGAAMMQEAPKSSRGIKIQYRITLINSKEMGLSFSGI